MKKGVSHHRNSVPARKYAQQGQTKILGVDRFAVGESSWCAPGRKLPAATLTLRKTYCCTRWYLYDLICPSKPQIQYTRDKDRRAMSPHSRINLRLLEGW